MRHMCKSAHCSCFVCFYDCLATLPGFVKVTVTCCKIVLHQWFIYGSCSSGGRLVDRSHPQCIGVCEKVTKLLSIDSIAVLEVFMCLEAEGVMLSECTLWTLRLFHCGPSVCRSYKRIPHCKKKQLVACKTRCIFVCVMHTSGKWGFSPFLPVVQLS